jgi:hypothetical protein
MKNLLLVPLCLVIGCAGTPGNTSKSVSTFDGSTQIKVEPAWVFNGWSATGFKLGLYRNSSMPEDKVIMVAVAKGAESIADGESLRFNFNGEIIGLTSIDTTTDVRFEPGVYTSLLSTPGTSWSSKRYETDIAFTKRLVNETNVTVRLELARDFMEGRISSDAPTTVRPAFRRFLAIATGEVATNSMPLNPVVKSPRGK